jgi:hypothetical protein
LQEQSFDDDDTESIAAIHSVSNAAIRCMTADA